MPSDFPSPKEARLVERMKRVGATDDPASCSTWLRDRVDRDTRRRIVNELFPLCGATYA
jgi:hypothetical protein